MPLGRQPLTASWPLRMPARPTPPPAPCPRQAARPALQTFGAGRGALCSAWPHRRWSTQPCCLLSWRRRALGRPRARRCRGRWPACWPCTSRRGCPRVRRPRRQLPPHWPRTHCRGACPEPRGKHALVAALVARNSRLCLRRRPLQTRQPPDGPPASEPAASEATVLASLWLLESVESCQRSAATVCLNDYVRHLAAFSQQVGPGPALQTAGGGFATPQGRVSEPSGGVGSGRVRSSGPWAGQSRRIGVHTCAALGSQGTAGCLLRASHPPQAVLDITADWPNSFRRLRHSVVHAQVWRGAAMLLLAPPEQPRCRRGFGAAGRSGRCS